VSHGEPSEADCGEVLAEVFLYLDGEMTGPRHDLIRHHLDDCSPCLRKYGIEREVRALVARKCGGDVAPEQLRTRVLGKLREVVIETTVVEYRVE
jgi:mycothiol system anti-sigma-R factor